MRLIDADNVPALFDAEFKETKKLVLEGETHLDNLAEGFAEAIHVIRAMQAIDAVPVVYCKDCKYADTERRNATEKRYYKGILFCRNANMCGDEPLAMWPDDFCSYGEKKEGTDHASG